jgi:hypothetical protein
MCKILANMTQVSDVAPGPLVWFEWWLLDFGCCLTPDMAEFTVDE